MLLSAGVWLLYWRICALWWTFDDLFHLHLLSRYSAMDYGFSPGFWHRLPFKMFTPLLFLSYDSDLAISGIQPFTFYVHQLVACSGAVLSLFLVLRRWFSTLPSATGAFLFAAGIPFATWAQQLMLRHYIEGFGLAAVSVWFFVDSMRGRRAGLAQHLSAVFYLLAMLAKEVYVPLPGLLLLLPEGRLIPRARRLRPHAVAMLVYFVWRRAMIGTFFGGYGWAIRRQELPGLILGLPVKVGATLLSGSRIWNAAFLSVLILGIICHFRRPPRRVGSIVGSAALLLAPVIPVSKSVNGRFGALLWVLLVAVFLSGCDRLASGTAGGRPAAILLLGAAAVVTMGSSRTEWHLQFDKAFGMSEEGRCFLSMAPGDLLRQPRNPDATMNETRWLKEEYLHLQRGAGWFADDIYLCRAPSPPGRIWEYDDAQRRIRDVTAEAHDRAARYCANLRPRAPLSATFRWSDGALYWTLGPYEAGRYSLVTGKGIRSIPVTRRDGYRLASPFLVAMVRYEAPEGWVTYSPELAMDFRVATRYGWERRKAGR